VCSELNPSGHSPLTSNINAAFSPTELTLTGYLLFFGSFSVNEMVVCENLSRSDEMYSPVTPKVT